MDRKPIPKINIYTNTLDTQMHSSTTMPPLMILCPSTNTDKTPSKLNLSSIVTKHIADQSSDLCECHASFPNRIPIKEEADQTSSILHPDFALEASSSAQASGLPRVVEELEEYLVFPDVRKSSWYDLTTSNRDEKLTKYRPGRKPSTSSAGQKYTASSPRQKSTTSSPEPKSRQDLSENLWALPDNSKETLQKLPEESSYSMQYLRYIRKRYPKKAETILGAFIVFKKVKYVVKWQSEREGEKKGGDIVDAEIAALLWPETVRQFLKNSIINATRLI